jgi:hypothetical protein
LRPRDVEAVGSPEQRRVAIRGGDAQVHGFGGQAVIDETTADLVVSFPVLA